MRLNMKKILLALLVLSTSAAIADTTTNSTAESGSTAGANASTTGNQSGNQGQQQGVNQDFSNHSVTNAPPADMSKMVGFANAPALTTTFSETCMGSTSAGAGFAGGAVSVGSTWEDEACIRRLDAREVKSMGDAEAAKDIMCGSDKVRAAFLRVGRPCKIDGGTYAATPTPININEASKQRQDDLYLAAIKKQIGSMR